MITAVNKQLSILTLLFFCYCNADIEDIFLKIDPPYLNNEQKFLKIKFSEIITNQNNMLQIWENNLNYPKLVEKITQKNLAHFFNLIVGIKCIKDIDLVKDFEYKTIAKLDKIWENQTQKESSARIQHPLSLGMCNCEEASYKNRIYLVFRVINDVAQKYPDNKQEIIYTGFASCTLLQDFMIVAGLIALGYNNLTLNFIDPEYAKPPSNLYLAPDCNLSEKKSFYLTKKEIEENLKIFATYFKDKIKDKDFKLEKLRINYYDNVYNYIAKVKANQEKKSNILITVDWGLNNTFELEPKDYNRAAFLEGTAAIFLKNTFIFGFPNFYLEISSDGSLLLWIKKDKSPRLSDFIQILIQAQEKAYNNIQKKGVDMTKFREYFIEELKSNEAIAKEFHHQHVSKKDSLMRINDDYILKDNDYDLTSFIYCYQPIRYFASIPKEWKLLIDETSMPKAIVYQLTGDQITNYFRDDTEERLIKKGFTKISVNESGKLKQKLVIFKENLIILKEKLNFLKNKLLDLKKAFS